MKRLRTTMRRLGCGSFPPRQAAHHTSWCCVTCKADSCFHLHTVPEGSTLVRVGRSRSAKLNRIDQLQLEQAR